MNGKLIGLLIRSNAAMIEAISASARLADKDGTYDENLFWGLRQEVIAMAEEAEAITGDEEIQQAVSIAAAEGAMHGFSHIAPMVPISPAHQIEKQPLNMDDMKVDRKFIGRSEGNGQTYCAIITEVDTMDGVMGRAKNCKTRMLIIDDKPVTPFERPLLYGQFTREFLRWVE